MKSSLSVPFEQAVLSLEVTFEIHGAKCHGHMEEIASSDVAELKPFYQRHHECAGFAWLVTIAGSSSDAVYELRDPGAAGPQLHALKGASDGRKSE